MRLWYFHCIKAPHWHTRKMRLTEASVDAILKRKRCPRCKAQVMGVDVAFEREVHQVFTSMQRP